MTTSYVSVPGSRAFVTRKGDADVPAARLEALDGAAVAGVDVNGHWLARTVVRDAYVPVLLDVFDRLALDQEPEEQALYLQLWRLALADERNHCRASRAELCRRTRLSDRRLGKALAGLVKKGHVALADRDRQGTLYRVLLPHEVAHEAAPDAVLVARRRAEPTLLPGPALPAEPPPVPPKAPPPLKASPAPAPRQASKGVDLDTLSKPQSMPALAAAFVKRFGGGRGRTVEDVLEELLALQEGGLGVEAIAQAVERFGARAPKKTPAAELSRYLA
jgi:hypothetical protein